MGIFVNYRSEGLMLAITFAIRLPSGCLKYKIFDQPKLSRS